MTSQPWWLKKCFTAPPYIAKDLVTWDKILTCNLLFVVFSLLFVKKKRKLFYLFPSNLKQILCFNKNGPNSEKYLSSQYHISSDLIFRTYKSVVAIMIYFFYNSRFFFALRLFLKWDFNVSMPIAQGHSRSLLK